MALPGLRKIDIDGLLRLDYDTLQHLGITELKALMSKLGLSVTGIATEAAALMRLVEAARIEVEE